MIMIIILITHYNHSNNDNNYHNHNNNNGLHAAPLVQPSWVGACTRLAEYSKTNVVRNLEFDETVPLCASRTYL